MSFNPEPSKQVLQLIVSRKRVQLDRPKIYFNNIQVSSVTRHKHLGFILGKNLAFSSHIKELLGKANKGMGMINLFPRFLPPSSLDQICQLHVKSHLDYCDEIYLVPPVDIPNSPASLQNCLIN